MPSLNHLQLIGHVGSDPEFHSPQHEEGQAVLRFRVATNWKGKNGKEHAEWHRIIVFGRSAQSLRDYLRKGRLVYIQGRLQTRDWEDEDGAKRYMTEVIAHQVLYLDKAAKTDGTPPRDDGPPDERDVPEHVQRARDALDAWERGAKE